MQEDRRRKWTAVIASLGIHGLLFFAAGAAGLFTLSVMTQEDNPIAVSVYTEPPARSASSGGGGGRPETVSAPDIPVVTVNPQRVPEISESFTREPERQEEYRREHQAETAKKPLTSEASPTDAKTGDAAGKNPGTDVNAGPGNGNPGNGPGNGDSPEGSPTGVPEGRGGNPAPPEPPEDPAERVRAAVGPQLLSAPDPDYPAVLQRHGVTGSVTVSFVIGLDGGVESASIEGSSGTPALDRAALAAVRQYRFIPARNRYGDPVRYQSSKTIHFRLR